LTVGTAICDSNVDGICIMPLACENYIGFSNWAFKLNFTSNVTEYLRIPLGTFAYNVKNS